MISPRLSTSLADFRARHPATYFFTVATPATAGWILEWPHAPVGLTAGDDVTFDVGDVRVIGRVTEVTGPTTVRVLVHSIEAQQR